ncbi:DUF4163 domain-containing protein [Sphingomonas sp.]|jgi:hypothetical protein|uniref:DUF4163 domain-containing protein n=1 Tax=Sphingomonas sp. TaxID=28214 RepID=UPI0035C86299
MTWMRWTIAAMAALPAIPASAITGAAAPFDFSYSYPPAAARIAPLRAWLERDKATLRTDTARDATDAERDARTSGFPYRRYETQKIWKLVTETPRFVSLSGLMYAYTGGAHGMSGSLSLLWDKKAGQRLSPTDLFRSPAAIEAALGARFCAALNVERAKRRGAPVPDDGDEFDACPKMKDVSLLLGSSNRRRFDRIGLIADPYVAGPYAEGQYEITLPVTPAVIAAVKPAYRETFEAR